MRNHSVIIGGFEPVYMQKLALYLGSRMGEDTRVAIAGSAPEAAAAEAAVTDADTVWIGSEAFLASVRAQRTDARCVLLAEEEEEHAVYRYQSCEKLYQQIMLRYRQIPGVPVDIPRTSKQHWIVLTTDGAAASLLAFSVTCAQILGGRGRVLYLNLSECSGMAELFLLEPGTDLSDLAAALRREEPAALEACVRQIEQMDYIMPPANPMILHELRESDIERLIGAVRQREEYGHIVVALGNSCCGCDRFFRIAERIFHLTSKEALCACSQREWMEFITICRGPGGAPVERIRLPQIAAEGSGFALLHAWRDGPPGQLARIYLDGEAKK